MLMTGWQLQTAELCLIETSPVCEWRHRRHLAELEQEHAVDLRHHPAHLPAQPRNLRCGTAGLWLTPRTAEQPCLCISACGGGQSQHGSTATTKQANITINAWAQDACTQRFPAGGKDCGSDQTLHGDQRITACNDWLTSQGVSTVEARMSHS